MQLAVHRQYIFILVALAIAGLGLVFDSDARKRIAAYNPPNIAHYDLRYDVFPPSSRLFKVAFLDPIESFENRDTVVLIGNSVIAGAGAKDKNFFNRSLSDTFNVINAGLNGEHLGASSALAVLGIDANFKIRPSGFHHIFVAYPPSRMYEGGYWVTGHALTSLAKDRKISDYVYPYSTGAKEIGKQTLLGVKGFIAENLRCIVDGNSAVRSIINRDLYCEKPFNTENQSSGFLKHYAGRMAGIPSQQEKIDLSQFMNSVTFIDSESPRNAMVSNIADRLGQLERFLAQNNIPHKIYFLLLTDSPDSIDTFPRSRQESYGLGRAAFRIELAKKKPRWEILDGPTMKFEDFFDAAHMRESGQAKLANLIKDVINRDRANNQRDQITRVSR